MSATPATPSRYRCGDLEIDVGLQRVARGGVELPLPKLSFDLLLALVEAAPNFLTNGQLMESVWPGLVVENKTVSQRVKLLRDALGDDPEDARYVLGLRGRGYRLKPAVLRVADAPDSGHDAAPPQASPEPVSGDSASVSTAWRRPSPGSSRTAGWLVLASIVGFSTWFALHHAELGVVRTGSVPGVDVRREHTAAVLPFRTDGGGDESASLALGVAETVLDRLSVVSGLDVIARDSSFKIAELGKDTGEIGRRLGARYLIDGTVLRTDAELRVTARLVDADTGTQVWAETFDRGGGEILTIQDDIARSVVDVLRPRIGSIAAIAPPLSRTDNVDAYLAFLRGRALLARWTIGGSDAAEHEFSTAIALDPHFAAAYASLYDARMLAEQRRSGGASPGAGRPTLKPNTLDAAREKNSDLIERALAIDPESGAAHFARAIWSDEDFAARDRDFAAGLAHDPSNGRGITSYAEFLDHAGRADEAEQMLARAIAIDPLSPRAYYWRVMRTFASDASKIERGMLGVLEIDPDYQPALQRTAKYRWLHGEIAQAIRTIEHALSLDPTSTWLAHTAVAMYLDIGDTTAARAIVAASDRPETAGQLLLDVREGDVAAAGRAAFEDSAFANGILETWGVFESVRDAALDSHAYDDAIAYIERRTNLGRNEGVIVENFHAVPPLAHVLLAAGRTEDARQLLRACIQWIDDYHVPKLGNVYALRVKASSLLLLGETDLALQTLDASFRADDYAQWWYTLERDPLWLPLHGDVRFEAIAGRVRAHIAEQRSTLAQFRSQSLVPDRTAAAPSSVASR